MYQVSNLGKIKSLSRFRRTNKDYSSIGYYSKEKILKPYLGKDGYLRIQLTKDKKTKACYVHRLVAQAFIPNSNHLPEVNHKDENKQNNYVYNLEFCDRSYNNNYGSRNNKVSIANSKVVYQYDLNDNFIKKWDSLTQIENELKIKKAYISRVCLGERKSAKGYKWSYTANYKMKEGII